mgnify:CR=1 FL=1
MIFYIITFIISIIILAWLSSKILNSLMSLAKYLGWREFVIAFFIMSIAGSLPNLLVGFNSVWRGMPEIAFGDIIGGNLVDLTLVMALAVFMSKKSIPAESKMIQYSAIFTGVIGLLPLLLILDGILSRSDGFILIFAFLSYTLWIFSKDDRFKKTYQQENQNPVKNFYNFIGNIGKIILFLGILLIASQFIVDSAKYFSIYFGAPLSLVGLLVVGLGNCFPEAYFSVVSARRGEGWLILGDLMGSVISAASLILGLIAIVIPFQINDFSPFLIARIFFIAAIFLFIIFVKTGHKVTKKEGIILLFVYILFLLVEIFNSYIS